MELVKSSKVKSFRMAGYLVALWKQKLFSARWDERMIMYCRIFTSFPKCPGFGSVDFGRWKYVELI